MPRPPRWNLCITLEFPPSPSRPRPSTKRNKQTEPQPGRQDQPPPSPGYSVLTDDEERDDEDYPDLNPEEDQALESDVETETDTVSTTTRNYAYRTLKVIATEHNAKQWEELENPSTEITLILADSQIRQQPGTGPEQTIVSRDLWKRYQLRAKALGENALTSTSSSEETNEQRNPSP